MKNLSEIPEEDWDLFLENLNLFIEVFNNSKYSEIYDEQLEIARVMDLNDYTRWDNTYREMKKCVIIRLLYI